MYDSCLAKQQRIKDLFASCQDAEARYQKIIEIGKSLSPLKPQYRTPENLVKGCQSQMYLHSYGQGDRLIFEGESDALISQGLAAILILVYSDEAPETILKCPPDYLEDLQLASSLTPNRANGLYSVHLRMKQDALAGLMQR